MTRFWMGAFLVASVSAAAFSAYAQESAGAPPQPAPLAPVLDGTADEAPQDALAPVLGNEKQSVSPKQNGIMPMIQKASLQGGGVSVESLSTLLFTPEEYKLLQDARTWAETRPPSTGDLDKEWEQPGSPGLREVALSGIVYRAPKEWTIWLNAERITPDAIPSEVLDLRVHKDFIELKWYDAYTNQIFPIRLRPHQRFNLDNRLFLPG